MRPDPTLPRRPADIFEPSGYHGWFPFSPVTNRSALEWPNGCAVAVTLILDMRASEWEPPETAPVLPPAGGRGIAPYPDFPRMSHREFGHRVGVFRLLDITRSLGIAPAAVVDVLTVEEYGPLIDHLSAATSEFIAGGLSASRAITSSMGDDEELDYIRSTIARLSAKLGRQPVGWLGVEHSESTRTPHHLSRCGIGYVADWGNDEQPFPMSVPNLWSFPLSWELSDLRAMFQRGVLPDDYARAIVEAFDVLHHDGATSGRVLALHLHPWISGQAFRAESIERALAHLKSRSDVWWASPGEIVDWCRSQALERGKT